MPVGRITLFDNNDSFTRNLEHLLAASTGARVRIEPYAALRRARDAGGAPWRDLLDADLLVISPGPGAPDEYPAYAALSECGCPVLGICLGMQIINEFCGGSTVRLHPCVHGRAEAIRFQGGVQRVARYHSLGVDRLGRGLRVTLRTEHGVVMALEHEERPWLGYQFHPESFLTGNGGFWIRHALERLYV